MTSKIGRKHSIGGLTAAAVLAAALIGYAGIPSSGGVISVCYNPSANPSGSLRVIDVEAGAKCGKNEKLLTFNQTGPRGPKGDKGEPGTNGTNGTNGINGTNGTNGAPGAEGPEGPAGISTATFAGATDVVLTEDFVKVASKNLPEGAWVVFGTANIDGPSAISCTSCDDHVNDAACELRSGPGFIGGARDRRVTLEGQFSKISLSMNGGAQVAIGGGEVSLWCSYQGGGAILRGALMVAMEIGGFSD